mgnify:CR=1 FL=1
MVGLANKLPAAAALWEAKSAWVPSDFDPEGGDSPRIREIRRIISKYRRKALHQTMSEFSELKEASVKFRKSQAARRSGRTSDQLQQLIEQTN